MQQGARIGGFDVAALLGRGGMGEVWRARDLALQREVALKVLSGSWASDAEGLARFEREGRVLASLNHPHIATIHGVVQAEGLTALVMELVEGPTLAELVARGPVPVEEARRLSAQIAAALEAAHDRGVIHRDLKPANIKLTPGGDVKVLDFGLAKAADMARAQPGASLALTSPALTTSAGAILGTAAYMSPEQAKGLALDRRSDIWSFGCIVYELLTAHRAFQGDSLAEVMRAILARDIDWSRLPPATPPVVRALLGRCLEPDPRQRLRDIGEARVVLADAKSAWEGPPGAPTQAALRPVPAAIAGLSLGIVLAGLLVWPWASRSAPPPAGRAMQFTIPLTPADRLPSTAAFERPSARAVDISSDGSVLLVAGERQSEAGPQWQLYRRPIDGAAATPIAGTEGVQSGFLSPDGTWVAFVDAGGVLRRVPIAGGQPIDISALDLGSFGGAVIGAAWADDGTIVLGSFAGPLRSLRATGGPPTDITDVSPETSDYSHRLPHYLPGGRGILFTAAAEPISDTGRIYVLGSGDRVPRLVLSQAADARYLSSGHLVFLRLGTLMVAPFDLQRLEVTGPEEPLVHDVMQSVGSDNPFWNSLAGQFDVSDTGTLVYAAGGAYPPVINNLLWLYRDGRTEPIGEAGRSLLGPRISPDGHRIVVAQMRDARQPLRVFDVTRRLWTSWIGVTGPTAFPVWASDGAHVLFASFTEGRHEIHMGRPDGSSTTLLTHGARPRIPSDVSLDGRLLAFVEAFTPTRMDVWVMPLDGSAPPRPVVRNPGDDLQPAFSPDGQWLAYASDVSGELELFVEAFPGPGTRIQVSSGGGTGPLWARDGRTLYYVKPAMSEGTLMEVTVETAPALRIGTPRAILPFTYLVSGPVRSHDVAPDGRRFVVTTYEIPQGTPVTQLQVVVNWMARRVR